MLVKNADELIKNACTPKLAEIRKILVELVNSAIEAGSPSSSIRKWVKLEADRLKVGDYEVNLNEVGRIVAIGGGKAGAAMAITLEQILGDRLMGGVVNIPGGTLPGKTVRKIKFVEAGHPVPTESGVKGTRQMLDLIGGLGPRDLVICLISGGGSALMPLPAEGIELSELQEVTQLLLKSGATIQEFNAVRKHLSAFKGGQLARAAFPARIVTLIISDVIGDRLDTIASGPSCCDLTTYQDAFSVLEKYELMGKIPTSVMVRLRDGVEGMIPETPGSGEECFQKAYYKIIASNVNALEMAVEVGRAHNLNVHVLTTAMQGEARQVGDDLTRVMREVSETGRPISIPSLLLSGGETTVTVKGKGMGGRNQELVLNAALGLAGLDNAAIVSFGTDGIDGPTDSAGAIADGCTLSRAMELGLDISSYLDNNDSYHFFKELGDLVMTGPSGTNIMDVAAAIVF